MKQAWSLLWLIVCATVVVVVVASIIKPWIPVIIACFILAVIVVIGIKIWRAVRKRRQFF